MKKLFFLIVCLFLSSSIYAQTNISKIGFVRGEFVYVQDVKTKQIKRVAKGVNPSISPDGAQIAYTENLNSDNPNRIVKVVELATNKARSFKGFAKFTHYGPVWSPDGKWIAVHVFKEEGTKYNWEVGVINAATGEARFLSDKIQHDGVFLSSWTANSESVVCHDLNYIYEFDSSGKMTRRFNVVDVAGDNMIDSSNRFHFSPDGKQILFDATIPSDNYPEDALVSLFVFNLETKKLKRLTQSSLIAFNPKWFSHDEIAFEGRPTKPKNAPVRLYKMSLAGMKPEVVLTNASEGSFAVQ